MTATRPAVQPLFAPPYCAPEDAAAQLLQAGFALLSGADLARWIGATKVQLQKLARDWDDLPPDNYLRDGGHYRSRRHACFEVQAGTWATVPHRAHWQPVEYNALHGGIERWFEPMAQHTLAQPAWHALLTGLGGLCDAVFAPNGEAPRWYVESHQFRIDTASGIGRPTPEGAHRDGVDLVAVILVARDAIKGGETRIFEAASPAGQRFTLTEPWSALLLDDARMVHETTPIQPLSAAQPSGAGGHRDTLVLTWRRGSFQGPILGAP
ncbi:MAG: 2OG-Fe dioxygenase family protein [Giesbergeria sp.]|jgi:hypothetical protein|nr:2OG-Fe dioxygenase family protein [Giesbergeria sp.]MBP7082790.1 2OG-Fe dioxygenase family protein [Giesbergeria sp.]MBP9784050.1 2OG-Fe dioxygenase family protein [Giesbergeria sp.]MBP9895812.1 2OG-Fe dioxygenase family protein [Giesbergeria sp.]